MSKIRAERIGTPDGSFTTNIDDAVGGWSSDVTWNSGNIVNRNGVLYVCKTDDHVSVTPPEDDQTNWKISSQFTADTVADMRDLPTTSDAVAYMKGYSAIGDGGQGNFVFDSSDLSTEVTADTQSGIYIAPNSDLTGVSGAWVRQYSGAVSVKWFGAVGDGVTDDQPFLQAAFIYAGNLSQTVPVETENNQDSGVSVEFGTGDIYKVNTTVSQPSRTKFIGNGAALYSENAVTLLDIYGFEVSIENMRFINGATAINFTHGNINTSTCVINDCVFTGQTVSVIEAIGTYSTYLTINECKFLARTPILITECDETRIKGGWFSSYAVLQNYVQHTGTLVVSDFLMVPSYDRATVTPEEELATFWFQVGSATQKTGNLILRRVRFGGERFCGYVKSYAKAADDLNGIRRSIDIQECSLWAKGDISFVEIPNNFTLKNNLYSNSGRLSIVSDGAGVVDNTKYLEMWDVDQEDLLLIDTPSLEYIRTPVSNSGGGKNLLATNAGLNGFSSNVELGIGGNRAIIADVWPSNSIYEYNFGTKDIDDLYFQIISPSTGLLGKHTFSLVLSADVASKFYVRIGGFTNTLYIPGDGYLRHYSCTGVFTSGEDRVVISSGSVPDSAYIRIGHPKLYKGTSCPDEWLQAPSTTTLDISLINGKYYAASPPTDGFWNKGCKIYNISPFTLGAAFAWICTQSGSPGSWNPFGEILA